MKWNAFTLISDSISLTKEFLTPFSIKRWLALGCVASLSSYGSVGGMSFNYNYSLPAKSENVTGKAVSSLTGAGIAAAIIGILIFIIAGLLLLLSWISSVFTMIFIDSLVKKNMEFKRSWVDNGNVGLSFFFFKIVFGIVSLGGATAILWNPVRKIILTGFENINAENIGPLLLSSLPYLLIFFVWIIILSIFNTLVIDFALPYLYKKRTGIMPAISEIMGKVSMQKTEVLVYIIARIVYSLCTSIVVGLACFLSLIIVAIPALIISLIVYFILAYVASTLVAWIVVALVIIIALIIFILIAMIITLPFKTIMGYFSILSFQELVGEILVNVKK